MEESPISDKDGDVEMKQLLTEKLGHGDLEQGNNNSNNKDKSKIAFTGLTKQQLEEIENNEPIWGYLRKALFVAFVIIWLALLIGAVIVIYFAPKCPERPNLKPWQSDACYRINPYAFKDSNGDGVGDLVGVSTKLNYLSQTLGIKNIIFDPINAMDDKSDYLGLSTDFYNVDKRLGSLSDLKRLIKDIKKSLMNAFLVIDFMSVSATHKWFLDDNKESLAMPSDPSFIRVTSSGDKANCISLNGRKNLGFYQVFVHLPDCIAPIVDLGKERAMNDIKGILRFWLKDMGFNGVVLTNVAFFNKAGVKNKTKKTFGNFGEGQLFSQASKDIVKDLRSVIDAIYSESGKEKFLLAEGGNTGIAYNIKEADPMVDYIGKDMAHGILTSEMLFGRGDNKVSEKGKIELKSWFEKYNKPSVNLYSSWPLADMFHVRYASLEALTVTFLLPGFPVVYMGTELLSNKNPKPFSSHFSLKLHPFAQKPFEMGLSYLNQGIMQWNASVSGFGSNITYPSYELEYREPFGLKNTVKLAQAHGSPDTFFDLTKQLISLRSKSESLQWGQLKIIHESPNVVAFARLAPQFPSVVVVLVRKEAGKKEAKGLAMSFSKFCGRAKVLVRFPKKEDHLKDGELVKMASVYVDLTEQSLLLLKCH